MIARTLTLFLLVCLPLAGSAQPTIFTYQGYLTEAGTAAEGAFDFELVLYSVDTGGTAIDVNVFEDVTVTGGLFSLPADFTGAPFEAGGDYWVEARVRDGADTGAFTPLLPRQPVNASPYAIAAQAVIAPLDVAGDASVQGELNVGGDINTVSEVRASRVEADEIWTDGPADFLGGALVQRGGDNLALLVQNDGPTQPAARVVGDVELQGTLRCSNPAGCAGTGVLDFPIYASGGDVIIITESVFIDGNRRDGVTARCGGSNDLVLFGDCRSGGDINVDLIGTRFRDVGGPSAPAFSCTYRNNDPFANLVTARIYCVARP